MADLLFENNNTLRQFLMSLQDHIVLKEEEIPKKLEGQQEKLFSFFSLGRYAMRKFLVLLLKH